ncbi:hypothetical protein AB0D57_19250 [Streptomyces sp. NPDC048275]|uniref:hypothetical protein n=1 Tax=Streptomyces sp. NPDC048275 TaxID=3155629 RepID=UPI00340E28B3
MRRFMRTTAVVGVLGTAGLLAIPTASASSAAQTAAAAPLCVTDSQTHTYGKGEIRVCIENGQARVTGWVEDLLPGGGWGTPDGGCVIWWIRWQTASGEELRGTPMACPHFGGPAYKEFDYDTTDESVDRPVDGITGVAKLTLGTAWA